MKTWEVSFRSIQEFEVTALVDAETKQEAIEKVQTGTADEEEEVFSHGIETKDYKAVEVE